MDMGLFIFIVTAIALVSRCQAGTDFNCGRVFESDQGFLATPQYPSKPNSPSKCKWTIRVTDGFLIGLEFPKPFNIPEDLSGCYYGHLDVYDVLPNGDRFFRSRWCDKKPPIKLTSTTSAVDLEYDSDSLPGHGFSVKWTRFESPHKIMGGFRGTFSSPIQASTYPNNEDLRWEIVVPNHQYVKLQFTRFDLGGSKDDSCDNDYIEVFDVFANSTLLSLGKFCGPDVPPPIKSFSSRILVDFHSDGYSSNNGQGFNAKWANDSSCGGVLSTDQGLVASVNYPDAYEHGQDCKWIINVTKGYTIDLAFLAPVHLQDCYDCKCNFVWISSVLPNGELFPMGKWCGIEHPPAMRSVSSTVQVLFKTNWRQRYSGFYLFWSKAENKHTTLEGSQGALVSPNYPSSYPENMKKRWEIRIPNDDRKHIELTFHAFDLGKTGGSCNHDKIEIYDIFHNKTLLKLGEWCGSNSPPVIVSNSQRLYIDFYTDNDESNNGQGFNASWSRHWCGANLFTDTGLISSPNYPNFYDANNRCTWTIKVSDGHVVQLRFLHPFDVGFHESGSDGVVAVYDIFPDGKKSIKASFIQTYPPRPLTSSSSAMEVVFSNSRSWDQRGFSAVWTKLKQSFTLLKDAVFTSPNYPMAYPENAHTRWKIAVKRKEYITLKFNSFGLARREGTACGEWVEIYDVFPSETLLSLGRWCGSDVPPEIKSSSSSLFVDFHSDNVIDNNGRGFNASWVSDSECGGSFNTDTGMLSSPNYPLGYERNEVCKWRISVDEKSVINITFHHPFKVANEYFCDSCSCASLKIFDIMQNGQRILRGKWCEETVLFPITTSASVIDVEFQTTSEYTQKGFLFSWTKSERIHNSLTGRKGTLKSSNYPSVYPEKEKERWEIAAPFGEYVVLKFNSFDLGKADSKPCDFDRIEIFDVLSNNSLFSLGQWCGSDVPPSIKSSNSKLLVEFTTDNDRSNSGKGFTASWTAESSCGGVYSTDQGVITSTNYPYMYVSNENCKWTINVGDGFLVNLVFLRPYATGGSEPCANDFVEVFDIPSNGERYSLGRWCEHRIPLYLLSSGSRMEVNFKSNELFNYIGFGLAWSKIEKPHTMLGGLKGSFKSPNFPSLYPSNLNTRWEIRVPAHDSVVLTFDTFDLGSANSKMCDGDVIQIFDFLSNNSLYSLGRWCGSDAPPIIKSSGPRLLIEFSTDSDSKNNGKGFSASWAAGSACGGDLTADRGLLSTPNYPSNFKDELFCKWTIKVAEGFGVDIKFFEPFQMDSDSPCSYDYVKIYDVTENRRSLRGAWCGNSILPSLTSQSSTILVQFESGIVGQFKGFSLAWSKIDLNEITTPKMSTMPANSITTDKSGITSFFTTTNKLTTISMTSEKAPFITTMQPGITTTKEMTERFITTPNAPEKAPFITTMQSGITTTKEMTERFITTPNAPEKAPFITTMQPGITTTKEMTERLITTPNAPEKAPFITTMQPGITTTKEMTERLITTPNAPECGGVFNTQSGTLTSPKFTKSDSGGLDCTWDINITPGKRVKLKVNAGKGRKKKTSGCKDWVEIFDYFSNGTSFSNGKLCGMKKKLKLTSISSRITIKYHSETGKKFKASWKSVKGCGSISKEQTGVLMSPNYPSNYPSKNVCRWKIKAGKRKTINLKFDPLFDLEQSKNCKKDFIKVYSGNRLVYKGCGNKKPQKLSVRGTIKIIFKSNGSKSGKGFYATWT